MTGAIKPCACAYCGTVHELATGIGSATTPSPGAISVCVECGEFSIWDEMLSLRKPTEEDLREIGPDLQAHLLAAKIFVEASKNKRTAAEGRR